ncbi:MAG: phage portal protein [Solobacterium sp.]|nr:phage portal protein [Solobacterium sp.]
MSKRKNKQIRNAGSEGTLPSVKSGVSFLLSQESYDMLCVKGYTRLDRVPAVVAACRRIAEAVGAMTIHLMENGEDGDIRIQNELSRKIDIDPCRTMTRSQFIEYIVMCMLLYGKGNSIVRVKTRKGILQDMQPIPPSRFSILPDATGYDYTVNIDGVNYEPDDVLHFVYNPDRHYPFMGMGVTATLQDVAELLDQASATEKGFMESKWKPSLIVKVDGMIDAFSTKEGRSKLIDEYITTNRAGEPWVIPADQIDVKEVRPLSLADIALSDNVQLDTRKVAALLGVPAFLLGVGEYSAKEWNSFIQNKVKAFATYIQQELTRKLILSPKWYLRFNIMSLYDYDLQQLTTVMTSLQDRGDVTGNEVRDRLGMSPKDGLNELKILENYIPADMSGNQSKLIQEGE